jgi:uncharacterized membrane protein YqaE (UPF0057 family)
VVIAVIFAIIFPPVSIGLTWNPWRILAATSPTLITGLWSWTGFLVGLGLSLLGWLPGMIFAFYLVIYINRSPESLAKSKVSAMKKEHGIDF